VADDSKQPPAALREGHALTGLGYTRPLLTRAFTRLEEGESSAGEVAISEEVPVSLVYNMRPHVVMMATPSDLEDFAVGFTLTEGIVGSAKEVTSVEVIRHAQGIEVQLMIDETAGDQLKSRGRSLIGRTGCGLCGVESIQDALRELQPVNSDLRISIESLYRAEQELPALQTWNRETGSLHAAAWATPDGVPRVAREDVGRHNALDKVIGALARAGTDPATGFFVLTSRASYELVQKVVAMGAPLLATVSRPTGLAIRLAEATNLTLVALLRGRSANVYAHPERLAV
jgi:FdhD protein